MGDVDGKNISYKWTFIKRTMSCCTWWYLIKSDDKNKSYANIQNI